MSELNDDMDELYRRAAEMYPLKTDSADWSKVSNALQEDDLSSTVKNANTKRNNFRNLLLIALLLFVPWVCYQYHSLVLNNSAKKNIPNQKPIAEEVTKGYKGKLNDQSKEDNSSLLGYDQSKTTYQRVEDYSNSTGTQKPNYESKSVKEQNNKLNKLDDAGISSLNNIKNFDANKLENVTKGEEVLNETMIEFPLGQKEVASPKGNATVKELEQQGKNSLKIDSSVEDKTKIAAEINNNKKTIDKKSKNTRFYIGVFTGADISTVKFQSVKNAGFSFGGLLGYNLNKNIAFETGAFWDKKFYYSDGQYFNTSKIYLPSNSVIDYVDGNCSMIEMPFNIKLNYKTRPNTTWFSLIGLSSYFMKKENYDYTLNTAGVYSDRYRTYTNSSTNWLSVMNLGFGYNYSFGRNKRSNLRIEPYFKIPLKGVGIGSLPITSSGINIGITKAIF